MNVLAVVVVDALQQISKFCNDITKHGAIQGVKGRRLGTKQGVKVGSNWNQSAEVLQRVHVTQDLGWAIMQVPMSIHLSRHSVSRWRLRYNPISELSSSSNMIVESKPFVPSLLSCFDHSKYCFLELTSSVG